MDRYKKNEKARIVRHPDYGNDNYDIDAWCMDALNLTIWHSWKPPQPTTVQVVFLHKPTQFTLAQNILTN
jgi:hypothetical protein